MTAALSTWNVVHEGLEGGWGIAHHKRHHQELVEPIVRAERRFGDVGHEGTMTPKRGGGELGNLKF